MNEDVRSQRVCRAAVKGAAQQAQHLKGACLWLGWVRCVPKIPACKGHPRVHARAHALFKGACPWSHSTEAGGAESGDGAGAGAKAQVGKGRLGWQSAEHRQVRIGGLGGVEAFFGDCMGLKHPCGCREHAHGPALWCASWGRLRVWASTAMHTWQDTESSEFLGHCHGGHVSSTG